MSNTILYFISSLFEIYALGIYSGQLFLPRHSKHTRIILLSVFCLVLFIVGLFQNTWLNITVFACILGIYMFSQYQTIWYICLFHTFLLTALDALTEMVVFGNYQFLLSGQHSVPDKYNCPFCTCAFQQTTLSLYRPDDCTSSAQ
mgnify:CR=1 FL=1